MKYVNEYIRKALTYTHTGGERERGRESNLIVFRIANDGTYGAKGAAPGRKKS